MASLSLSPFPSHHAADRRAAGLAVTVLVHVALIGCWYLARTAPPVQVEGVRRMIQWIDLPVLAPPLPPVLPHRLAPVQPLPQPAATVRVAPPIAAPVAPPVVQPDAPAPAAPAGELSAEPARPSAATILERARQSAGSIDRALRKENRPYIVAPLDSPEIRMRNGMEKAHALAPPKLWEAPKVEELVNQTGDGARRTRVITANGTYCISERAPTTNVEMIEMHGKERITNCPQHEDTASPQQWRTARD